MNRRRWVAIVGLTAFFVYVVLRSAQRGNDFKYPYLAAQALWRTNRLHVSAQPRYPVSFHVLLAPLASLPIGVASTVWAVLSFTAVGSLPRVLKVLSGLELRRQVGGWFVVLPFFIDALVLGQSDPINLALVAWAALALVDGRPIWSVALVGTAGMIKFLPIFHWATILARSQASRVWWGMILTTAFGFGAVATAVGWSAAVAAIQEQAHWIVHSEKPWHLVERGSDLRVNNESLPIALARTFADLGGVRPLHSLSLGWLSLPTVWFLWSLILATLSLTWLGCVWRVRAAEPLRAILGVSALTSIIMLACTPICWHHYFLWLTPAVMFLARRRRLLWTCGTFSLLATAIPIARGVGAHMLLALGLFAVVAHDLWREPGTVCEGSTSHRSATTTAADRPQPL